MKILHTSDWHLGRSLYGRKRYGEFVGFLDWLAETIEEQAIDALLVAGDIFDTGTPGSKAQSLYYRFLCRVAGSSCRDIIVIAGNHDSPSFLNAPKELLKELNIHVVGARAENPADEVIVLYDTQKTPKAIVCAVPYLRDKDIRTVDPGETIDDKNRKLVLGIKKHYADVCDIAEDLRAGFLKDGCDDLPIIAMGHLFTAGGRTVDGDGVRELYVGSLVHVGNDLFPSAIDYLALGHLHVPQSVGKTEHIRYSGSPIPMGFGEATQRKIVLCVEFTKTSPVIQEIPVPCFQELIRIVGQIDQVIETIEALKQVNSWAWLEIEYTGREMISNLRERIDEAVSGSDMEIRRIKNKQVADRVINSIHHEETLDDLDAGDVFRRCLDACDVSEEDRAELFVSYNEILQSLQDEDVNVE